MGTLLDHDRDSLLVMADRAAKSDEDALDLAEMDEAELAAYVASRLPEKELKALPEVKAVANDPDRELRDHRSDYEAAALGAMLEAEREDAARAQAGRENAAAELAQNTS